MLQGLDMVWYRLEPRGEDWTFDDSQKCAQGLLRLKDLLDAEIPARTLANVIIGTWNIKEFGAKRDTDAVQYIAETVSRFDVCAIQEVRSDLEGLHDLMRCLGSWYEVFYTDVTKGKSGNDERMAFVYDSRKIRPTGLVGEVVLPPEAGNPAQQLARTPMLIGFRTGWFNFNLAMVHILYGGNDAELPARTEEIQAIANAMRSHADKAAKQGRPTTTLLLGDFNIFSTSDVTFKAITDAGFIIPEQLQTLPTSVGSKRRHYDQIAVYHKQDPSRRPEIISAGVPNLYSAVYRLEDRDHYAARMEPMFTHNSTGRIRDNKSKTGYYKTHWRTRRLSDHLPMWVALEVDDSREYIARFLTNSGQVNG